jgi:DNA-binding MltR family transcriptional regulator
MKPSRNRGVKKPKLRDYSHLILTQEEKDALAGAAHSHNQHPIVIAILACVLIEHELDRLLRNKLKKKDDNTWQALQSETGPLRSFSAKISMAYALGIHTEKIQHDLNVVRIIRNAFAHSKKLIDFNDPLIISELISAHILAKKFKRYLQKDPTAELARAIFIIICLRLQNKLLLKETSAIIAKSKRSQRRKPKTVSFTDALLGNPYAPPMGSLFGLPTGDQGSPLQLFRLGRPDDPNPPAPLGLLSGLSVYLDKKK